MLIKVKQIFVQIALFGSEIETINECLLKTESGAEFNVAIGEAEKIAFSREKKIGYFFACQAKNRSFVG